MVKIEDVKVNYYYTGNLSGNVEGVKHDKILPYLSVVQSTEGYYDISCNNGEFSDTKNGGVFIAPPNVRQIIVHHNGESGIMKAHWIFIDVIINGEYSLEDLFKFPLILDGYYNEEIKLLTEKIANGNGANRQSALYRLVEILVTVGEQKEKPDKVKGRFENFVLENYMKRIGAEDIAHELFCSTAQVFRYSQKFFSLSPANYINLIRLKEASRLLSTTDKTVTEIASAVGLYDGLYFSKLFHRFYGTSPTLFRKSVNFSQNL